MAYIGLAKFTVAKLGTTGAYTEGFSCGHAMSMNIAPQYAEGSLFGDNMKVEYDKEFKYADITIETTSLPIKAHEVMFGHTISEGSGSSNDSIAFKATDESGYVGVGVYVTEKVDGKKKYVACWMPKCKFSEGEDAFKTKGDNIEYQTPSISGQALASDDGTWKEVEVFGTEEAAIAWVNEKAGITAE